MRFFVRPAGARLPLLSALLCLTAACKKDSDLASVLPPTVAFTQAGLYPEGTQYDDQQAHFLVSSQTAGRIGQVTDDGTYTTFADDAGLISTIGLQLDAARNRVLAAVSDPGYNAARTSAATRGQLAAVAIFDRSTGTKTGYFDLGALRPGSAHFANDLTVDSQGNAYVTDSFAPVIYKITPQGTASVFLANAALAAPAGKFGLNGIVYHPSGYLLVAKSDEGALIKVPLSNPAGFTRLTLPAGLDLTNDDGLQLLDNTTLLAACNSQGKVYKLTTADDFGSVQSTGPAFDTGGGYPTTLARRAGSTSYVLQSHLDALQARQNPPVSQFALRQVTF